MALQLVITNVGRAAVINQAQGGFRAVRIAAVGVSSTAVAADPAATALPGEVKRLASIAGEATAADVVHLTVTDESDATYAVRSFALYLSDGTLFALYGQADTIVEKSAQALLLLAIDVTLSNIPAAAITFGNANFTNPAGTTERAGVVELATEAEAAALADATRVLTPKAMAAIFTAANVLSRLLAVDGAGSGLDADLLDGRHASGFLVRNEGTRPLDYDYGYGTMTIRADVGGWALGYAFQASDGSPLGGFGVLGGGNSLPTYYYVGRTYDAADNLRVYPNRVTYGDNVLWHAGNDGSGSGLDADLLDGRHAADFALLSGASFSGTVTVGSSAIGRVALAPSGGSANTGYIEFSRATGFREGYIGFAPTGGQIQMTSENGAGFNVTGGPLTHGGAIVWDAGNDGSGSSLDADLLDGLHGSDFVGDRGMIADAQINTAKTPGFYRVSYSGFSDTMLVWRSASSTGTVQMAAGFDGRLEWRNCVDDTTWSTWRAIWHAGNDGAGSGLDADLLDGREAAAFALLTGATFSGNIGIAPTGAGQVFLAHSGTTTASGYVEFRRSDGTREGYIGFAPTAGAIQLNSENGRGFNVTGGPLTRATNTVWDAGNDGAGSGLDADLLDGWQRDDVRDWNNILNRPGAFPAAAHSHGAADIAGAFPASLSGNGYVILPNGLILQWVTGAQQAASSEGTQYVAFPIAFNTCFQVITSTQVANPNIESHAIYQLISFSAEGATVMRQLVSASGADREPSWPRLFAIGR